MCNARRRGRASIAAVTQSTRSGECGNDIRRCRNLADTLIATITDVQVT
jgi:hypothetical protein